MLTVGKGYIHDYQAEQGAASQKVAVGPSGKWSKTHCNDIALYSIGETMIFLKPDLLAFDRDKP